MAKAARERAIRTFPMQRQATSCEALSIGYLSVRGQLPNLVCRAHYSKARNTIRSPSRGVSTSPSQPNKGSLKAGRLLADAFFSRPASPRSPVGQREAPGHCVPLYLRPGTSDWMALRHVFEERDCDVGLAPEPGLIIDGGANVGFASVLFANKYPRTRILAVEPHRDNTVIIGSQLPQLPKCSTHYQRDMEL